MNSNSSYSPETAKLGVDLCDLDLWPFAWTSLLSLVITPENFMMIQMYDDGNIVKKVWQTDRWTDGRTDWTIHRAAWWQLKNMYDFVVNTAPADGLVPSSTLTSKGTVMNKVGSCLEVGLALEWLTLQKIIIYVYVFIMLTKYLSLQQFCIGLISNWIYSLGSKQWYASIDSDNV